MKRFILLWLPLFGAMVVCGCGKASSDSPRRGCGVKVVVECAGVRGEGAARLFSGTVEEESGTSLSFSGMGTLKGVYVEEGEMVAKGALLAEIDGASVRNAYEAALAGRKQAEDAYARMKQLHEAGSLPEIKWIEVTSQLQQAVSSEQIARKGVSDCRLYAPYGGYIARKSVEMGQNVGPGVEVVKLVRIDRVKVKVSVPEEEIGGIRTGATAEVSVEALGGRRFVGKVMEKGVEANPLSRTYDVKVGLENGGHELLPGMVCDVRMAPSDSPRRGRDGGGSETLLLPAEIVQIDVDNRPFVWTAVQKRAHKVYVTLGENVGRYVEISGGLSGKEDVIVKGQQKVSEGSPLQLPPKGRE